MKRLLFSLLFLLMGAVPAVAQVPGGGSLVIDKTPVHGGTPTDCLIVGATGKLSQASCGGGGGGGNVNAAAPLTNMNVVIGAGSTNVQDSGVQIVKTFGAGQVWNNPTNATSVPQASSVLNMPDGLAGTPTYSFFNSPTSGIYSAGADSIDFQTSGNRLVQMSLGSGVEYLQIVANSTLTLRAQGSTNGQIQLMGNGTGSVVIGSNGGAGQHTVANFIPTAAGAGLSSNQFTFQGAADGVDLQIKVNVAGATSSASSITTTVLTVGGSVSGAFGVGQTLSGAGITAGTVITSLGSGTGGAGTYNINNSQTVGTEIINASTVNAGLNLIPAGTGTIQAGGVPVLFSAATGVQTFLTTPNSSNLAAALTDETGTGSAVFGTTPTLTTPIIASGVFGSIPSASGTGKLYFATDYGASGALLRANGTRWKLAGGKTLLAALDTASSLIANSPTIVFQKQFPIGAFQVGDRLELRVTEIKSGTTDTCAMVTKIGTAGTSSDTSIYSNTLIIAANRITAVIQDYRFESVTTIHQQAASANTAATSGYSTTSTAAPNAAVTISDISANSLWFDVSIQSSSTNDTCQLQDAQLYLTSGAN